MQASEWKWGWVDVVERMGGHARKWVIHLYWSVVPFVHTTSSKPTLVRWAFIMSQCQRWNTLKHQCFAVQICLFQVKGCFDVKSFLFRSVCVCVSSEALFHCEEFAVQICVCVSSEALFQCEEFAVQISVGVSGERPFRCEDCGRGFIRWFTLKRHRQKHQGLVHFTCQVCGDAFSSRESLKRHRRVHTGESASVGSISIGQHWQ